MGQTLSEPVVDKYSSESGDDRLIYGASCMQGWRVSMEDAHTTILKLEGREKFSYFGVYDGHGGQNVAKYSGEQLHKRIANDEAFKREEFKVAIKNGFLGTDSDLKKDPEFTNDPSGCTAVTALITPDNRVFVGNAGDSRAIMSVNGEAKALSFDHKPVNRTESSRIVAAGGFVEFGRVNGNLALSRAIGDFEFKQNVNLTPEYQIVTSDPEITEHPITEKDEFIVLACDGIWDCMTSEEVVEFVRQEIAKGSNLSKVCEDLMERCLAPDSEIGGVGCDNMTVIIVGILNGMTEEEWYEVIKKRVAEASQTDKLGNSKSSDLPSSATDDSPNSSNITSDATRMIPDGELGGTEDPLVRAKENSYLGTENTNEMPVDQTTEMVVEKAFA